jgi:hypothetical protein
MKNACLLLLFLALFSCKEEFVNTVEVEVPTPVDYEEVWWSEDPNRRAFNIVDLDDGLLIQGESFCARLKNEGEVGFLSIPTIDHVKPINRQLQLDLHENYVNFNTLVDRFANLGSTILSYEDVLGANAVIQTAGINHERTNAGLNDQNTVLIPFRDTTGRNLSALLIYIDYPDVGTALDLPRIIDHEILQIATSSTNAFAGEFFIYAEENAFFITASPVAGSRVVYRLDLDAKEVTEVGLNLGQVVSFEGEKWAIREEGDFVELHTYNESIRQFEVRYLIPSIFSENVRLFSVDNQLFLYYTISKQLLIAVERTAEFIQFEPLNIEELNRNQITDIGRFQDKAYLSTLSGTFERDWTEFIESRIAE